MTPEHIAEIRAIIDGTSGVFSNASPRTIKAIIPIIATQSLPQALDTIEAQQRRIEELEAALKPFADDAAAYDPEENDDHDHAYCSRFEVGHLRSARSALQPKEPS